MTKKRAFENGVYNFVKRSHTLDETPPPAEEESALVKELLSTRFALDPGDSNWVCERVIEIVKRHEKSAKKSE